MFTLFNVIDFPWSQRTDAGSARKLPPNFCTLHEKRETTVAKAVPTIAMMAGGSSSGGTNIAFGRVISKEPTKVSPPLQDEEDLRFTFEAPGAEVDQEKPYWCARCRTTARFPPACARHAHLVRRKSSKPALPLPPTGCRETAPLRRRRR